MVPPEKLPVTGIVIACWGVGGVVLLVSQALVRLTPLALEPLLDGSMNAWQLALYVAWTVFNAYAEGYRGFQRSFAPRVVSRALYLARHPKPLHVLLAPAFCMALFHAKRRREIVAWTLLVVIAAVVTLVRLLPQPWRGIVDAGVVVGLMWGIAAMLVLFAVSLWRNTTPSDDSLPSAR